MTTTTFQTRVHLDSERFTFLKQGRTDLGMASRGKGRCVNLRVFDASSGQKLLSLRAKELRSGNEIYGREDVSGHLKPGQRITVEASLA